MLPPQLPCVAWVLAPGDLVVLLLPLLLVVLKLLVLGVWVVWRELAAPRNMLFSVIGRHSVFLK